MNNLFVCKNELLDAQICCHLHIQIRQKFISVKYDYMQISGWKSLILQFE